MSARASERRAEAGFTMIEVMVAMLLTALAVMGIIAMFMSSTQSTDLARHTTEATVLAQDKIEFLRTQGAAVAQSGTDTALDDRGVTGSGIYTRTWTETVSASADYATISVSVTWYDGGVQHTVTLNARRGL